MKKLKIGLVYDLQEDYYGVGDKPKDFYAEFDSPETIEAITSALQEYGHQVTNIGNFFQLNDFLKQKSDEIEIFFNLSEGLYGRAREAQVPCLLDAFRKPYTGSDATTLCISLDKHLTKSIVTLANLKTSPWMVVRTVDDLANVSLSYPLFAKPLHEGSSKGIEDDNLVIQSAEALQKRVSILLQNYSQPVLIEEFLNGREFTVGVLEVNKKLQAIGVAEIRHRAFDKLEEVNHEWEILPKAYLRILDKQDPDYEVVCQFALKACETLLCKDISRVDIRYNKNAEINLLEINPLPSLHPKQSAISKMLRESEYSYNKIINAIIESAALRFHISD